MFSLSTAVVGYPEADLTTILSQKRQMITGPLSMTSRKVALFTTGKSPLLALKPPPPDVHCISGYVVCLKYSEIYF